MLSIWIVSVLFILGHQPGFGQNLDENFPNEYVDDNPPETIDVTDDDGNVFHPTNYVKSSQLESTDINKIPINSADTASSEYRIPNKDEWLNTDNNSNQNNQNLYVNRLTVTEQNDDVVEKTNKVSKFNYGNYSDEIKIADGEQVDPVPLKPKIDVGQQQITHPNRPTDDIMLNDNDNDRKNKKESSIDTVMREMDHKENDYDKGIKKINRRNHRKQKLKRTSRYRHNSRFDDEYNDDESPQPYYSRIFYNNGKVYYREPNQFIMGKQRKKGHRRKLKSDTIGHHPLDYDLPPYIRKYNRRNKQLLDLLEGTISPTFEEVIPSQRYHHHHHHHSGHNGHHTSATASRSSSTTTERNIEIPTDDIFVEQQYKSYNNAEDYPQQDSQLTDNDLNELPETPIQTVTVTNKSTNDRSYKISPKANNFIFYRVGSPKIINASNDGGKKQKLPFVAITDKRLATQPNNLIRKSNN